MRQAGLFVATFSITVAVLTGLFFVVGTGAATPAASTSPGPTLAPSPAPTARPARTGAPSTAAPIAGSGDATPLPAATGTTGPRPSATPGPAATATARPGSKSQLVIEQRGVDYAAADVPDHASLTESADGSLVLQSDRTLAAQLEVDWLLPAEAIPAGARVAAIDVRVCGSGSGDFWETYGPDGSDPVEHEVTSPASDGCWHYDGAPGHDTTVKAIIRLGSTLTIRRVEYTVTLRP